MAAQATHPGMQVPSGATSWPAPLPRRKFTLARRSTRRSATGAGTWMIAAGLAAVSVAGAVALLIGLEPARNAVAIVAVVASIATGVLAHLAPRPPESEVQRPTRGEAF